MKDIELGAMRQKLDDTARQVENIALDVKAIREGMEKKYLTRLEGRAVAAVLTIAIAVITILDKLATANRHTP